MAKPMTAEQLGQAYEFLLLKKEPVPWAPAVIAECARRLRVADLKVSEELESLAYTMQPCWPREAIQHVPYDVLGDVLLEGWGGGQGRERRLKAWYERRESAIEAGEFKGREVVAVTYEGRKAQIIEELLAEASVACKRHGIDTATINVDAIPVDGRDDFVTQNGSNQMVIMSPGENDGRGGETFGVEIRNAQGIVIKNLLGREATITLGGKE